MANRNSEAYGLPGISGLEWDSALLDAQGSAIYEQMDSTQGSNVSPSQPYPNNYWDQSFTAGSSQTLPNLQSTRNVPTYFNSAYLSPNAAGMTAPMIRTASETSQQTQSSLYPSTGGTGPTPSPQSMGGQSPLNTQKYQGSSGELAQPVMSPISPFVGNDRSFQTLLSALIQIIMEAGRNLYPGCPTPSHALLRSVKKRFQEAMDKIDEMIEPNYKQDRNAVDENKQFQCLLCTRKPTWCKNRGTFTRHVHSMHHPAELYRCPYSSCNEIRFTRKDKHHGHMRAKHAGVRLTPAELVAVTEPAEPPRNCVLCGKPVNTWTDFLKCLCKHCLISDDEDNGWDGGDNDDNDDDGNGGDNDGRNQHYSSPGNGYFGNANGFGGFGPGNFNSNQFDGPSSWNGGSSYPSFGGDYGMYAYSDRSKSQKTSSKSDATGLEKDTLELKPTEPIGGKSRGKKIDPSATWIDVDARMLQAFRAEFSLRLKDTVWTHQSGLTKQNSDEKQLSDKVVAADFFDVEVSRDFQRLRYFECRIFENQLQGSFLAYIHETLVDSQLAIVSSTRDILYRKVDLDTESPPEIPADHIFYLAKEKDHPSSEANLEATRRTPKTRAHLRVRIRAIAGILALRAAVSKTEPTVVNSEVGDGWELGIPISSRATQEEAVKLLVWLVQVIVFFLKMPPRPKVFVLLEEGSLDVPNSLV